MNCCGWAISRLPPARRPIRRRRQGLANQRTAESQRPRHSHPGFGETRDFVWRLEPAKKKSNKQKTKTNQQQERNQNTNPTPQTVVPPETNLQETALSPVRGR